MDARESCSPSSGNCSWTCEFPALEVLADGIDKLARRWDKKMNS